MTPNSSSGSGHAPTIGAIGSPPYMSPEQAEGKTDSLGVTSDVYSLGATLYVLLTGQAPVKGKDTQEILERVRRGEIIPPRSLNPRVPRSLEAICSKALALNPRERYPRARDLADDVKRWLADEAVKARRDPPLTRVGRWTRKHQVASATVVATLAVGLAATLYSYRRERAYVSSLALERNRAGEREDLAITAVRRFGDVISKNLALKTTSSLGSLRQDLLKEQIGFFRDLRDRLQADRDTRPESLFRLAQADVDVGNLIDEIGKKGDAISEFTGRASRSSRSWPTPDPTTPQAAGPAPSAVTRHRIGKAASTTSGGHGRGSS